MKNVKGSEGFLKSRFTPSLTSRCRSCDSRIPFRPRRIVNQIAITSTSTAAAKAPPNSHSVVLRMDVASMSTRISIGLPARRSASVCAQVRMLPRSTVPFEPSSSFTL